MTRWVHGVSKDLLRSAFSDYFGVSIEHADIVVALYGRPGEWTSLRRLQVLLDSHRPPKRQAVYERIRVLREAMEPESLLSGGLSEKLSSETVQVSEGYALSEIGFAECAKAIRSLAEVLLRAGPMVTIATDETSPVSELGAPILLQAVRDLEASRPDDEPAPSDARRSGAPCKAGAA